MLKVCDERCVCSKYVVNRNHYAGLGEAVQKGLCAQGPITGKLTVAAAAYCCFCLLQLPIAT